MPRPMPPSARITAKTAPIFTAKAYCSPAVKRERPAHACFRYNLNVRMQLLKSTLIAIAVSALLIGFVAIAQKPAAAPAKPIAQNGRMHLWSKVGSFTLEGTGHVEMNFTGTLLLNNFK